MTERDDGISPREIAASRKEATSKNQCKPNTIILRGAMPRCMAVALLGGWHTMPALTGGNLCGGNPYQYVRTLRGRGIEVTRVRADGEQYGRYKITDPVSRALVARSLKQGVG